MGAVEVGVGMRCTATFAELGDSVSKSRTDPKIAGFLSEARWDDCNVLPNIDRARYSGIIPYLLVAGHAVGSSKRRISAMRLSRTMVVLICGPLAAELKPRAKTSRFGRAKSGGGQ